MPRLRKPLAPDCHRSPIVVVPVAALGTRIPARNPTAAHSAQINGRLTHGHLRRAGLRVTRLRRRRRSPSRNRRTVRRSRRTMDRPIRGPHVNTRWRSVTRRAAVVVVTDPETGIDENLAIDSNLIPETRRKRRRDRRGRNNDSESRCCQLLTHGVASFIGVDENTTHTSSIAAFCESPAYLDHREGEVKMNRILTIVGEDRVRRRVSRACLWRAMTRLRRPLEASCHGIPVVVVPVAASSPRIPLRNPAPAHPPEVDGRLTHGPSEGANRSTRNRSPRDRPANHRPLRRHNDHRPLVAAQEQEHEDEHDRDKECAQEIPNHIRAPFCGRCSSRSRRREWRVGGRRRRGSGRRNRWWQRRVNRRGWRYPTPPAREKPVDTTADGTQNVDEQPPQLP